MAVKSRFSKIIVGLFYSLSVLSLLAICYLSLLQTPVTLKLAYGKTLEVSRNKAVLRDEMHGYSVHLPASIVPVKVTAQQVTLGRGVYADPIYVLKIDTFRIPHGVPKDEYLSLMYEAAEVQTPEGYEFIFAQEFRQHGEPAVQRVYLARAEPPLLEHQYIYAREGSAYMLRFFYKLDDQSWIEPEIEWFKDSFQLL